MGDAVVTVQRTVLPAGLPVLPQVSLAAQYSAEHGAAEYSGADDSGADGCAADDPGAARAVEDDRVGRGDWFDAVPLGGGRVALVVGDVVGSGVPAVSVMAQLRTVPAQALLDGVPAGEALARLNRYAARVPAARGATVGVAVVDPPAGTVEYGGFGHPPPLVAGAAGRTRFLPVPPSRPLGLAREPPVLRSARLTAGEVLLLYTDGLVQRPGRSLSDGMEELARVVSAAVRDAPRTTDPGLVADRVCGRAVEQLVRPGPDRAPGSGYDEAAVLAAELRDEPYRPLALELPADAVWLRSIRRALDEWLHGLGAGADDTPAVHLAVVEAAANCVEHAYPDGGGWMWLDAVLDGDGRLLVTVTDHGRWRPPPDDPSFRGRGMRLMRRLMESVDVHRSDRGTTVTMARTLHRPAVFPPARGSRAAPAATVEFGTEVRPGPRPCLVVSGPVDLATTETLRNRIAELSRGGVWPVDIDLAAVTYLASPGVRLLHECARAADRQPGRIRVLAPVRCPARYLLELTGLDQELELLPARRPC